MRNIKYVFTDNKAVEFGKDFNPMFSYEEQNGGERLVIRGEVQSSFSVLKSKLNMMKEYANLRQIQAYGETIWTKENDQDVFIEANIGTDGCVSGNVPSIEGYVKLNITIYIDRV